MTELSEVSRGYITRNGKDQTIGGFQSLKDTKKYNESRQLPSGGYLCKDRVELKSNAGVQSISSMSERQGSNGSKYNKGLLEEILDRKNLNLACKRI